MLYYYCSPGPVLLVGARSRRISEQAERVTPQRRRQREWTRRDESPPTRPKNSDPWRKGVGCPRAVVVRTPEPGNNNRVKNDGGGSYGFRCTLFSSPLNHRATADDARKGVQRTDVLHTQTRQRAPRPSKSVASTIPLPPHLNYSDPKKSLYC